MRELARIIESLEKNIEEKTTENLDKPHHKDRSAFQRNFAADAKKVYDSFDVHPFEEMNLVSSSNTSISYDEETTNSLKLLLSDGKAPFQAFLNERLIDITMSINATIKKSNYKLLRTTNDTVKAEKKKLRYTPAILNKIREPIHVTTEQANQLFKTELFEVAQSTVGNTDSLYHSSKSDIFERFPTCKYESATDSKANDSALIIDLLLLTKSHPISENTAFLEFADSLRKKILNESSSLLRCDVITDQYFKNSLKQNIQSSRGLGSRKHLNDETKIPGEFRSNFLTNSDNKNVETPIFQKHFFIIYNDSTLTKIENLIAEDEFSNCDIEEADQRMIRHLINCAKNGFKKLFVSIGDTDVLILLMSVLQIVL